MLLILIILISLLFYFELDHSVLGSMLHWKKNISVNCWFISWIISSILPWCISCGERCNGINCSNTATKYVNCVCTNLAPSWECMLECQKNSIYFSIVVGGSFIPALKITAPAPVGPGFIELLQSVKMATVFFLSDCKRIRTRNHLALKRTLNHLAKLAKWLSCVVKSYPYGTFDCMLL